MPYGGRPAPRKLLSTVLEKIYSKINTIMRDGDVTFEFDWLYLAKYIFRLDGALLV
jgi:hypothetical protein